MQKSKNDFQKRRDSLPFIATCMHLKCIDKLNKTLKNYKRHQKGNNMLKFYSNNVMLCGVGGKEVVTLGIFLSFTAIRQI